MPSRLGQHLPPLHFKDVLVGDATGLPHAGHPWSSSSGPPGAPGCVANIAHLTALHQQFAPLGVDFLAVSNERPPWSPPSFTKHPMQGVVAIDPGFSLNKGLQEPGLPFTLLVDQEGRVAAAVRPESVTPVVLKALVEAQPLPLEVPNLRLARVSEQVQWMLPKVASSDLDAAVRAVVRPASSTTPGSGFVASDDYQFSADALPLHRLLALAADVSDFQIRLPDDLNAKYSAQIWVPQLPGYSWRPLLLSALEAAAGLTMQRETSKKPVAVLQGFPGTLTPAKETLVLGGSPHPGLIEYQAVDAKSLASELGEIYGMPSKVDSGAPGMFTIRLEWTPGHLDELDAALAAKGLHVKREKRAVETLIFTTNLSASQRKSSS